MDFGPDTFFHAFCETYLDIIVDHTSSLLAIVYDSGIIQRANSRLGQLCQDKASGNRLGDLMVSSSAVVLNRMLGEAISLRHENREILNILTPGTDMPSSYDCVVVPAPEGKFFFYAEPKSAVDDAQAKEYALINNALATATRSLQKSNYEMNILNEKLHAETVARARIERKLAEAAANELQIGAQIQETLLIGQPSVEAAGIDIAALTVPSQTIDGDFYLFFKYGDRCFDLAVGDVMGKGVHAALIGAACRSQIHQSIGELSYQSHTVTPPEPCDIMQAVHNEISNHLLNLEKFITLNYSRFDLDRRTYTFVDAGHTKTGLFSLTDESYRLLSGNNRPLGVEEDEVYKQDNMPIRQGDVFLFYSDGLSEAMSPDRECFGEERIMQTLLDSVEMGADAILHYLIHTVDVFTHSASYQDDLTCVIVKINEL